MKQMLVLALALVPLLLAAPAPEPNVEGVSWAVLVAGSNGFYNYRHQADVCHAYQIMRKNGIPDERIIVFMYDDIANNAENPTKGIIINKPNGTDVYHDVPKDYTGADVTPQNFLNVLQGKSQAMAGIGSGKVLKSGPNDHVFVFFSDHGAPGLIAFPSDMLYAQPLNNAIQSMFTNKQYSKLVFYLEACEAGSMFDGLLPNNINVFATSASNPTESSYACYWDAKRNTYLGDVYSVEWMEDSDVADITKETLQEQFAVVKKKTNTSHVMEYGDLTIGQNSFVGQFQGNQPFGQRPSKAQELPDVQASLHEDAVRSEDVQMVTLYRKLTSVNSESERQKIVNDIAKLTRQQERVQTVFSRIVAMTAGAKQLSTVFETRKRLTNFNCYEPVVDVIHQRCFSLSQNDHALRHLYTMVNLCEMGISVERIMSAINETC